MTWRPRPRAGGAEAAGQRLSPLEVHVLQRLDGEHEVALLPALTGLGPERLAEILERLVQAGAVHPRGPGAPADLKPPEKGPATDEARRDAAGEPTAPGQAAGEPAPDVEEAPEALPDSDAPTGEVPLPEALDEADPVEAGAPRGDRPADGMALHARDVAPLDLEARIALARQAAPPLLGACCFDPSPRVIAAVLSNPRTGLAQARLIARHHRDATGLEHLVATPAFAADAAVRLELLKNPQLQAPVLRRLWGQRRALELWKTSTSHEATEQARHALKELFRARFNAAEAEERVEVILKTDGRCLPGLPTSPLDGRTVALLCARSYTSTLLVQHLARWSATPTALLVHLLRQPVVRQNRALRQLVQQHPNAPSGEAR